MTAFMVVGVGGGRGGGVRGSNECDRPRRRWWCGEVGVVPSQVDDAPVVVVVAGTAWAKDVCHCVCEEAPPDWTNGSAVQIPRGLTE